MKLTRKVQILLFAIALLFSIMTVSDTYSKYLTSATGTSDISIARWRILVNNEDIRNNSDISQVITPIFDSNSHIAEGVIAPTSQGYFDIIIDHTAADVSFNYEIGVTTNESSSVTDIMATGYSINGGEIIELEEGDTISADVLNSTTVKVINIRIYIIWDDSETNVMNNSEDTEATISSNPAKIDTNLTFTQIPETSSN